jgi:hypothetical protein
MELSHLAPGSKLSTTARRSPYLTVARLAVAEGEKAWCRIITNYLITVTGRTEVKMINTNSSKVKSTTRKSPGGGAHG